MVRRIFPYRPDLKLIARKLRNNMTLSEVILWKKLNGKQMLGYDFHRQKPIDNFIVDFFCSELLLIIEIDGSSHDENKYDYDQKRIKRLKDLGLDVLIFGDIEVKTNINNVLNTIELFINSRK